VTGDHCTWGLALDDVEHQHIRKKGRNAPRGGKLGSKHIADTKYIKNRHKAHEGIVLTVTNMAHEHKMFGYIKEPYYIV
jgi:hypothetical protein